MRNVRAKWPWIFDAVCVLVLVVVAVSIAYPRWRAGMDWRDEGLLAYGAMRVLNGEAPHRDFVSVQPPLSYYSVAALFKICGTSLATLRILGLSIFLGLPLLIYGIGRTLTGPMTAFAAAVPACILGLPYVYFVPLAPWQGIATSLAAVLLAFLSLTSDRRWLAFPAGVLTATSLFLRHDQGIYTAVSMLVLAVGFTLASDSSLKFPAIKVLLSWWLAGLGLTVLPAIFLWWKMGALSETFRQLVVFPFATYRKTSALPFPHFGAAKTASDAAVVTLFYLPGFIAGISLIYLVQLVVRRGFRTSEAVLLFLVVWSGLFYLQVMVRSDQTHLLFTLPPLFLLAAYVCWIALSPMKRLLRVLVSSGVAVVALWFLWMLRSMALPNVTENAELLTLDRAGVRVQQPHIIEKFVTALKTYVPPNRSMLALPYQPMFYFLCDRRNPTHWNYLWPGDQTPADQERFVQEAEADPPSVVLLARQDDLSAYAPTITRYIDEKYFHTGDFGNLAIYLRREPN